MAEATGLEIVDKFFALSPERRMAIQMAGSGVRFLAVPLKEDTLTRLHALIQKETARPTFQLYEMRQFFYPADPKKAQYIVYANLPLGIFCAIQKEFGHSLIIIPGTLNGENPLTAEDLEPNPITKDKETE